MTASVRVRSDHQSPPSTDSERIDLYVEYGTSGYADILMPVARGTPRGEVESFLRAELLRLGEALIAAAGSPDAVSWRHPPT